MSKRTILGIGLGAIVLAAVGVFLICVAGRNVCASPQTAAQAIRDYIGHQACTANTGAAGLLMAGAIMVLVAFVSLAVLCLQAPSNSGRPRAR